MLAERHPACDSRCAWMQDGLTPARSRSPIAERLARTRLAYVIYTSGSTGRPKGVHGDARATSSACSPATDAWFGFGRGRRVDAAFTRTRSTSPSGRFWGALPVRRAPGRRAVRASAATRCALLRLLARERVTVLNQTPIRLPPADPRGRGRGGATELAAALGRSSAARRWTPRRCAAGSTRRGDARPALVNMYGITETTVHVTFRVIREADVRAGSASPIGLPIAGPADPPPGPPWGARPRRRRGARCTWAARAWRAATWAARS